MSALPRPEFTFEHVSFGGLGANALQRVVAIHATAHRTFRATKVIFVSATC